MDEMGKGVIYKSEIQTLTDPVSKTKLIKLSSELSHTFHLYFTNDGWYENETKLIVGSDRDHASNLYSLDLLSGEFTQLTEYTKEDEAGVQGAFLAEGEENVFLIVNNGIRSLHLPTLKEESYYEAPNGYHLSNLSLTADGKEILFALVQDVLSKEDQSLGSGYLGFEEIEQARPHSEIILLEIETKKSRTLHEENRWIGHVNASPTQSHLLSFCHEGPWDQVDHRIWIFDREQNKAYKLGEFSANQFAGHEYWLENGTHIGFHGYSDSLEQKEGKFIGSIKYDRTEQSLHSFPYQNMHIHSNTDHLIVGDGQQRSAYHGESFNDSIFLWLKEKSEYIGPYILCQHRGSFQSQKVHVHPRLSPDEKHVLFTSDMDGYGQIYLVEIPTNIKDLPLKNG